MPIIFRKPITDAFGTTTDGVRTTIEIFTEGGDVGIIGFARVFIFRRV